MHVSDHGRDLIAEWEGFRAKAYDDNGPLPGGYLTIGFGHMLTRSELRSGKVRCGLDLVRWADGLTREQCLALLVNDLAEACEAVDTCVDVRLAQHQYDALVSFAFNSGVKAFMGSTLLKRLNAGRYEEVPTQLRRWIHSSGRVMQGLVNRREHEIALWEGRL